ncbi:RNA polymerase subunit sigma-70 [[Actinomadura] parvosata subsp. kistnae]|uniref:RNA polymerase subunit sigma-70 n=1 Tax=[Actinomadura] parvosata subsp. kistnae TaxID=1909395 RepID=A0A1V0AJJ7_9ACTN|nr:sigma-70 family RNA polymerase sigma factor [Nonomuraea sp. ATCC 55076]AQZ70391.1 RNA polymerase subunit sigma-70 [Nonomuraea sp. ATCC 55076]
MTDEEELAAAFEDQRSYLHAMAYRLLGSHADADDAVQEAWLRLVRNGAEGIGELRGWLTTVTVRICLDVLRRHGVRREQPLELEVGMLPRDAVWEAGADPEQEALLAESVGLALYVVMDVLTPAERVAFVLHDVFEVPFDGVAAILGRSTAATKMLASRARGRLRAGVPAADTAGREVVDAFFEAVGHGDVDRLLTILAPDAELRSQTPGGVFTVRGAREIAGQATLFRNARARLHPALVDGAPGAVITIGGRPTTVVAFTIVDGVITTIRSMTDPARLGQVVPAWVG